MAKEPERFKREFREYEVDFFTSGQHLTEAEILGYLASQAPIDGWISGDDEITETVLREAAPQLKVISKWGSGLDSINLRFAADQKIIVLNSPGEISIAVAEVALGYAINLLRGLSLQDHEVRRGNWIKPTGHNLAETNVGILGFGKIGKRLRSLLETMGANVFIHDPEYPELSTGFPEMIRKVMVLFLCAPLNHETQGIISRRTLIQMPTGSYLVNVSRGPLVIETDLAHALDSGKIAGAALDVFEEEPLRSSSPLVGRSNVIFGCHNANNSMQAVESVHVEACLNIRKVLLNP